MKKLFMLALLAGSMSLVGCGVKQIDAVDGKDIDVDAMKAKQEQQMKDAMEKMNKNPGGSTNYDYDASKK